MTFQERLNELMMETASDNWDGEDAKAIPPWNWEPVRLLAEMVRIEFPRMSEPTPSVDGAGNCYLQWASKEDSYRLVVEFDYVGVPIHWVMIIDLLRVEGSLRGNANTSQEAFDQMKYFLSAIHQSL